MKLLDDMVRVGLKPDACSYNILLHGYCRAGRIDDAVRLFREMLRNEVKPGIVTYNIVASGSQPSRSQSHTGRSFKPREHGEQRRTRFSSSSRPWEDGRFCAFSRDVMQQHVREDGHILVQVNLCSRRLCSLFLTEGYGTSERLALI